MLLPELDDGDEDELLPAPEPIVSDEDELLPRVLSVSVEDEPTEPELEPELIVPGLLPELLSGRVELAPEPAPEPMLLLPEPDEDELLPEVEPAFFCHFWNSDCDSEPSLLASAVVKPELSSDCIAASVCEMRPSRFASSDLKVVVVAEPAPEVLEPVPMLPLLWLPLWRELLLPEPIVPLPWLCDALLPCVVVPGELELLWP